MPRAKIYETRIGFRTKEGTRRKVKFIADSMGLTVTEYINKVLVEAISNDMEKVG